MESVKINAVERTEKQGKKGLYTIYGITYNGNKKASTLKMEIGEHLAQNIDKMVNVDIHGNNKGYMEVFAVEGVQVAPKGGGGGYRKMSPEEQARIDKAMEQKRNGINAAVSLQEARAAMPDILNLPCILDRVTKCDDPLKEYMVLVQEVATGFHGILAVLAKEAK